MTVKTSIFILVPKFGQIMTLEENLDTKNQNLDKFWPCNRNFNLSTKIWTWKKTKFGQIMTLEENFDTKNQNLDKFGHENLKFLIMLTLKQNFDMKT